MQTERASGDGDPSARARDGELVLYTSPRAATVRGLVGFSALVLAGSLWAAWGIWGHLQSDADAAVLAPVPERAGLALFVGLLAVGLHGALLAYLRVYATSLRLHPATGLLRLETLRLWGSHTRTLRTTDIASASFHRGQVNFREAPSVNAPWYWVTVSGQRGFLLDGAGAFPDRERLGRLLGGQG